MVGVMPIVGGITALVGGVSLFSVILWGINKDDYTEECQFCLKEIKRSKTHIAKHSFAEWHHGIRVVCKSCVKKDMLVKKFDWGYVVFNEDLNVVSEVSNDEFEGRR